MGSNYKLSYNVDIVFCIDCTESMDNILNIVKQRALGFYDDVVRTMQEKGKTIDQLRVRVVAFRDYAAYARRTTLKPSATTTRHYATTLRASTYGITGSCADCSRRTMTVHWPNSTPCQ